MIITGFQTAEVEQKLTGIVGSERTVRRCRQFFCRLGMGGLVTVGTPYYKGDGMDVFEPLGGHAGITTANGVFVVIDFLPMVGEIDNDCIAMAPMFNDAVQYMVIVKGSIVILGDLTAFLLREKWLTATDAVGSEHAKLWHMGIAFAGFEMLADKMEYDEVAGGCGMNSFDEIVNQGEVVRETAAVGLCIGFRQHLGIVEKTVEGKRESCRRVDISLVVP